METVAFYSYKGGVGRTLLLSNTAQFLAMSGRRVVALDLDLEAPGLHQKLGDPEVLARAQAGALPGAVDHLLVALKGESSRSVPSLQDSAFSIDLPLGSKGSLTIIPAGSAPSHAYWAALEELGRILRCAPPDAGLLEAVVDLQMRIRRTFKPDYLLIDSRTGITELGGLATSILADRVVCLTTTALDSLDGTRVVAEALRVAPRLKSQKPLRLDFLITRVPEGSLKQDALEVYKRSLGGNTDVLPHDSGIAMAPQLLATGRPATLEDRYDEYSPETGERLFSRTLQWIAKSFPTLKAEAESAERRMREVHWHWRWLTRGWERIGGGTGRREAWPVEQLRERVRFGRNQDCRQADIVVYDKVATSGSVEPLMIFEYIENEDRDEVVAWWFAHTKAKIVAIASHPDERHWDRPKRVYSRDSRWSAPSHDSDRYDLPLPFDFAALPDPADVSVEALLDAVRRGHREYLERLITEWVRSSASGLHGGAPWKPEIARKIVDGLAAVEDKEVAESVLWRCALVHPHRRRMWLGDGDEHLDEQVITELFSPLLWRLPPKASTEFLGSHGRPFGPPPGSRALAILARDLLGLDYDPDASFRREGQSILDKSSPEADKDRGLYELIPAFRHTEITFKMSDEDPPLTSVRMHDGDDSSGSPKWRISRTGLADLLAERRASRTLVTTGLLGNYDPELGRVTLFEEAIDGCATKLALRPRHVGSVALIHESIHALMHVGRDLDRRIWSDFSLPCADRPQFEPSVLHETLAQYFTYKHLCRLRDEALLRAFEVMNERQHPAYRAWRRIKDLPLEDVRSWFLSVRRGFAAAPFYCAGQSKEGVED